MDFRPPGGESPCAVLARVSSWLADIAAGSRPTLAIAHRGVIGVVLAAASHWDVRDRPPVALRWSAMQIFRSTPSGLPAVTRLNVPLAERPGASVGSVAQ